MPLPTDPRPGSPVELLAPAGDWDCARAAVENGANAIYFGLDHGFNARARATNFAVDDLPELLAYLHRHGVKGYLTFNTLLFSSELAAAEEVIRAAAAAGVDALLVQDLGGAALVRAICPQQPVHASTQMTLTSAATIAFAEKLGIERAVLARELSLEEISRIDRESRMPLEAFVHGALCVAYSGQCLTSESLGGRSANRGQCAQACRMPYELTCDGNDIDLGAQKYLLSPQDLAAYHLVPELIAAGVISLKIEGRLKTPEYVANITRHYRRAIDEALAERRAEFTPQEEEEMQLSFSRGFSPGWLGGCDHKMLVPGMSSSKRGVLLGEVRRTIGEQIEVQLACSLRRGDGLVLEGDRFAGTEQGGRVYEIFVAGEARKEATAGELTTLAFAHGSLDFGRIASGQQLWKTDDPQLTRRLRRTFSGDTTRRLPIELRVTASVGQPLRVEARAADVEPLHLQSEQPLEAARKHPLTQAMLVEQFGRLGGTSLELHSLEADITGGPMVPLSVLGKLRKQLVAQLSEMISRPPRRQIASRAVVPELRKSLIEAVPVAAQSPADDQPQLHLLCRTLPQLQEALTAGATSLYVDFQDIREYRPAVEQAHTAGAAIRLATPRIQKPDEYGIFRALAKHKADGWLVRNLAGLLFCKEQQIPCVADFSLNAANELTAALLMREQAQRVTTSYDLNVDQLRDMVAHTPAAWLEVVVHQHMPMFHMEHCVFCAVLSPGTNKTNCGRPCDDHLVKLRDQLGMEHPLHADVGCRNTLYNATPQSAAEAVPALVAAGVKHFRVELMPDAGDAPVSHVLQLYRRLLAGELAAGEVWRELKATNRVGVTRGTMEAGRDPLAII
jgi:putative protease